MPDPTCPTICSECGQRTLCPCGPDKPVCGTCLATVPDDGGDEASAILHALSQPEASYASVTETDTSAPSPLRPDDA